MKRESLPLGNTSKPNEGPVDPNRRNLILGAGAAALAGGSYLAGKAFLDAEGKESIREHKSSELFNQKTAGFETLYSTIHRDEILFVDENGTPVETVKIAPHGDLLPAKSHEHNPLLQFDAHGLLIGELNPKWIAQERVGVCRRHPGLTCDTEKQLPHELNVLYQIRDAIENTDDPFDPKTYLDVIKHFGTKEVINGDGFNRIEYVQHHGMEGVNLPSKLKSELKKFLPGLAAQESHFNNASKSGSGAQGIFQFMPATWQQLGRTPAQILSLPEQVKAVGEHLESGYLEMERLGGGSYLSRILEEYFAGDEDLYMQYFMTPMLINSYNSGVERLLEVAAWYEHHLSTKKAERTHDLYPNGYGYDLFHRMTTTVAHDHPQDPHHKHLGGYRSESSEYFPRVYAFSKLLED